MGKKSHLRGTFATFAGLIGDEEDLLTGRKPYKEMLRFHIDEVSGEAVLIAKDYRRLVEDPSVYSGGFQLARRLRLQMDSARNNPTKGDLRRSSKLGFDGSGVALAYTVSAPGSADSRQWVVSTMPTIRAVVDAFRDGKGWSLDYVSNFGRDVETEADRERDYAAIIRWCDQHGC